ncbi:cytochrome P450 [Streptomyces sp. NBC_01635]|uniref:cytochrome P450 n=1 Tax=Streptomyces sp. NBC_01635 TaxID=2975904 RepID=UPI00386E9DD2|nr:cytochrome P450 [Streptomyces sp. NBC_01635]
MTESRKSEHAYHLDNTDPSLAPHLFETLKDVQRKCPVAWSDAGDGFWMLTKYADITAAANDWETYTVEEGHTIPSTGKSVMLPLAEVDPPLHTPWRRFLVPYFTPKTVESYRPVIERIVEDAFSDLAARGRGDLVFDVARKVPTSTISAILGFDQDGNHISDIVDEWMASTGDPERARSAAAAVETVVKEEIGKRRGKPAEDVLGRIMEGEIEGAPLTDDELLGLCIVFIVAGHGTTVDGITNTVHRVLAEPGLMAALQADRSRLGKVIDESLRINPPVWNMGRTARKDAEVRGVGICPGEKVMLTFGAGNYDPEKFEEPDRFDPDRPGVHGHLTFGFGRHRCIGEALAKLEITIVLEYILDGLPDLALDGKVTARTYFTTYGFTALPVRHGAAAATA